MPLRLVGTRSRAIRRGTSGEGANVKAGEADGKEPQSDSATARSQRQQKEPSRHTAPDAPEAHPNRRRRSGSILSLLRCHANESTLTRNSYTATATTNLQTKRLPVQFWEKSGTVCRVDARMAGRPTARCGCARSST